MNKVKVNGVEIMANDLEVLQFIEDIIGQVSEHNYPAFEIDFFWLKKVVFFDSYKEVDAYQLKTGEEVISRRDWDGSNGCYEPRHKAIYLFKSDEVIQGGEINIATTLLHELSHYIMDSYDLLSRTRYARDPIYRFLEEIRVNNMSLYLAKAIFGGSYLRDFEYYTQGYRRFMSEHIRQAKVLGYESIYLKLGRGVANLMQMGDLDL